MFWRVLWLADALMAGDYIWSALADGLLCMSGPEPRHIRRAACCIVTSTGAVPTKWRIEAPASSSSRLEIAYAESDGNGGGSR